MTTGKLDIHHTGLFYTLPQAFLPVLPQLPNPTTQVPVVLTDGFSQQEQHTQGDDSKQLQHEHETTKLSQAVYKYSHLDHQGLNEFVYYPESMSPLMDQL